MRSEPSAGELLAAGNEAMLEAGFRTGDYRPAWQMLEAARERACLDGDRVSEAAALTRLGMLAHFEALGDDPARVRVQVWLDDGQSVSTVVPVWPAADWYEREAWDMYGVRFDGHPNLVRILMPADWEGHPLRKDYPLGGEPVRFSGED